MAYSTYHYQHNTPLPFANRPPEKWALLIGCNYPDSENSLRSCGNDVLSVAWTLIAKFEYNAANIKILVDDPDLLEKARHRNGYIFQDQYSIKVGVPNRESIIQHMCWLASKAASQTCLFFHFSGHGEVSNFRSRDGRTSSNLLLPTDYSISGKIVDYDINKFLVCPLPANCTLHALIDCCHSGTMMDLEFCKTNGSEWRPVSRMASTGRICGGGRVFQFSSCSDGQQTHDNSNMIQMGEIYQGLATRAFLEAVVLPGATYASVLASMSRQAQDQGRNRKIQRNPQLSTNQAGKSTDLSTRIIL